MNELQFGYTTGVYASAAFKGALCLFNRENYREQISVETPLGVEVIVDVVYEDAQNSFSCSCKKGDNDDYDVTKGCAIKAVLSHSLDELPLNKTPQTPHFFDIFGGVYIYAGKGVGVATKDGLKVKKGYPAINPAPLNCMYKIANETLKELDTPIYIAICVENGENIAKETANQKVGVIGGISILGTTGIVKPISNEAFLDSIKTEISVIAVEGKEIVLTIGNTAHKEAIDEYGQDMVVEIGNFVKDTIETISQYQFLTITLIAGIGKMAKIGQGFKNTHNKYGDTDFNTVNGWLLELGINVDISEVKTIKGVFEILENDEQRELFANSLKEKAKRALFRFLPDKSSIKIYTKLSKA